MEVDVSPTLSVFAALTGVIKLVVLTVNVTGNVNTYLTFMFPPVRRRCDACHPHTLQGQNAAGGFQLPGLFYRS